MKGYDSYKNSGIDWIGKIPKEWRISKLKFVTAKIPYPIVDGPFGTQLKAEEYQESGIPLVRISNLDYNCNLTLEDIKFISDEKAQEIKRSAIRLNDIIIGKTGATIGKSGLNDKIEFGIISSSCLKISIDEKIIAPYFFKYFVISNNFQKIILQTASGSTRDTINITPMANLEVVIPSLKEQTQIATFLDYKTNLIDATIEKKKRLIELLKEKRQAVINEAVTKGLNPNAPMKDSGVEWLGEIPEHWKVVRLKQIANAFGRIGYRGYTTEDIVGEDEGAITISPSNMKGNYMTFESCTYINWDKYEESPEIKIYNDDILMVKTGSTYGKVGIVKNLNKKATINPQLLVLKDVKINSDYLYNLLRTNYIQYQVETNVIGSTIPTISQTKILNFSLPLPPNDEIEEIMNYIQNQMNIIDKTTKLIENQIKNVQTYRQSLISEAVTGKIDVRDWQINNN